MNTKTKGDLCELRVAADLIKRGYKVLFPYGENCRYDLVIEDATHKFHRIQCKYGRYNDGCITFSNKSVTHISNTKMRDTNYKGQIDFFCVFCEYTNKTYMVPIELSNNHHMVLRVEPTKNNQSENINWAKDFELFSEE